MEFDNNFYEEYMNLKTKPPVGKEGFDSLYEFCKASSYYHFDNNIKDTRLGVCENPLYLPLCRFTGDWSAEIDQLEPLTKPFTFDLRGQPRLQTNNDMEKNDFDNWGYTVDGDKPYIVLDRAKTDLVGKFGKLVEMFGFNYPQVHRFDIQKPGQMFYYHIDNFGALLKSKRGDYDKFADCDYDQRKMIRMIIMLTDQEPGHVWQQGNMYLQWKKGDCFTWPWRDVPHGTCNFGHTPRMSLNITGAVTEKTLEVFKNFPKTFNLDEL